VPIVVEDVEDNGETFQVVLDQPRGGRIADDEAISPSPTRTP